MNQSSRVAAAAVLLILLLAGCTSPDEGGDGIAVSVERTQVLGPPFEKDEIARLRVSDDGLLAITTFGSGSCPHVPTGLDRKSPTRIGITMAARGGSNGICTADLGPTTVTVRLPEDVEYRDSSLRVDLDGLARDVSLPVRLGFGPDGEPELTPAQQRLVEECVGRENALAAPGYVTMPEAEVARLQAESEQPVRVVARDGECLGRDDDRRDDRVNLILDDGQVIWAGRF